MKQGMQKAVLTFTYMQPELCSTTTPADCVAPLGACAQQHYLRACKGLWGKQSFDEAPCEVG